jgi:hypothetical protein
VTRETEKVVTGSPDADEEENDRSITGRDLEQPVAVATGEASHGARRLQSSEG